MDQLFMLRPGFYTADAGPCYCPDALGIEGLLSFFPDLRKLLNVRYLEYARPRRPLVELLGEALQGTPALVLRDGTILNCRELTPQTANGREFFSDPPAIRRYLSTQYGFPGPS